MPEVKGKMLICDRCGQTHFMKYLRTETLDGGFGDRICYYEDRPKEWLYTTEIGELCPECANDFKYFVSSFMDGRVAPIWKHRDFMNDKEKEHYYGNT